MELEITRCRELVSWAGAIFRVKSDGEDDPSTIPEAVAAPIPANIIKCGRKAC